MKPPLFTNYSCDDIDANLMLFGPSLIRLALGLECVSTRADPSIRLYWSMR